MPHQNNIGGKMSNEISGGHLLSNSLSPRNKKMTEIQEAIKRRVRAVKKLQLSIFSLEMEFHKKIFEIEAQFEKKYQDIFEKRADIINGTYEPKDEECDSEEFRDDTFNVKDNFWMNLALPCNKPIDNMGKICGIPNFWLCVFKSVSFLQDLIQEADEPVIKHLMDISVVSKLDPEPSFTFEFKFSPNEYFSNKILTKQYFLKCTPDPDYPYTFDGPEIYKCIGCTINWFEGKDLTSEVTNTNCINQGLEFKESFFKFFNPPAFIDKQKHDLCDEVSELLEADFELAHFLKERVIPRAVLFFTGETTDLLESSESDELDYINDPYEGDTFLTNDKIE